MVLQISGGVTISISVCRDYFFRDLRVAFSEAGSTAKVDTEAANQVNLGAPPTMFSGYGEVTEEDLEHPPAKVLEEHELVVKRFLEKLTQKDLVRQVVQASKNPLFDDFVQQRGRSQKFGLQGNTIQDICEFDVWLKKKALSDLMPSMPGAPAPEPATPKQPEAPKPAMPKQPEAPTPAMPKQPTPAMPKQPEAPKATPPKPTPPSAAPKSCAKPAAPPSKTLPPDAILELSPEEKKAYAGFWSKYKPPSPASLYSPTSPASTPVASPAEPSPKASAGTIVTPECKKRLELTPEGLDVFQLHSFFGVHLYVYIYMHLLMYMSICVCVCAYVFGVRACNFKYL